MNILVTGGTGGLGKSIVEKLTAEGHRVYFTYNSGMETAEYIVNANNNAVAVKCNFADADDILCLENKMPDYDLDVLINNAYAGAAQGKHFHKTESSCFSESFSNNIIPVVRLSQSAIKIFKDKKFGKIINILTSYIVNIPPAGFSIYTANKAYLMQLSKSINSEYSRYNITSNCISPDFMLTNLSSDVDERIIEQMRSEHPLKKLLTTDEVAETVSFLVGSSQQLNGAHIVINAAKNVI